MVSSMVNKYINFKSPEKVIRFYQNDKSVSANCNIIQKFSKPEEQSRCFKDSSF